MASPIASPASQSISTVVFGITATIIGAVTVLQTYRAWRVWYESGPAELEHNVESDIELGLASSGERSNEAVGVVRPSANGGPPEDHQADDEPAVVATRSHPAVSRDNDDGPSPAFSRIGDNHTQEEPAVPELETAPSLGRDSSSTKSSNNHNDEDAEGVAVETHPTFEPSVESSIVQTDEESNTVRREACPTIDRDGVDTRPTNDKVYP